MSKLYRLLLFSLFLAACGMVKKRELLFESKKGASIHPSSTILGQKRQYAIVSEKLDSVTVVGGKSVKIEQGKIDPGGRSLKVYITVNPLVAADSLDKAGKRIILIYSRKGMEKVILDVIDEKKK